MRTPFPQSYDMARTAFRSRALAAGATLDMIEHDGTGLEGETLSTDIACLGPADAPNLLMITSGVHGLEGHLGSAIQQALLDRQDVLDTAAGLRLVIVHAVNPYGFSFGRRVTAENVDLNRNFLDADAPPHPPNPDYPALHPHLMPEDWAGPTRAAAEAGLSELERLWGKQRFLSVLTSGQSSHPDGLFFTGNGPVEANLRFRALLDGLIGNRRKIGLIDLHGGLGEAGHGEIMHQGSSDIRELARLRSRYGAAVTSTAEGSAATPPLRGHLAEALEPCRRAGAEVTAMTLEFGTVPIDRLLLAGRAEHWLAMVKHGDAPGAAAIRRELRECLCPDDPAWRSAVLAGGLAAIARGIAALAADR